MGLSHGAKPIVTNGLIFCLDARNLRSYPGSGTTWTDLCSNSSLTLSAGVTFSSTFSGVLTFNGTSSATGSALPATVLGSGDFTFECWFRNTSTASGYSTIYSIDNGSSLYYQNLRFGDAGFGDKLQIMNDPTQFPTIWSMAITKTSSLNNWYQAVHTRSSGTNVFRLNNSIQNLNNGVNPSTYPFTSFTDSNGASSATNLTLGSSVTGNIGIFRIYNRALSSTEITQNFNLTRGRYGI